jgi:hypothetical protein
MQCEKSPACYHDLIPEAKEEIREEYIWDINGTIIKFDSADSYTPDQEANELTARRSLGHCDGETGGWTGCQIPNCKQKHSTYYEYAIKRFNPKGGESCKDYKHLATIFTDPGQPGECFRPIFEQIKANGSDKNGKPKLFESFLNLYEKKLDAAHIFYTFGHDGRFVMDLLKAHCKHRVLPWNGYTEYKIVWIRSIPWVRGDDGSDLTMEQFNDVIYRTKTPILLQADVKKWKGEEENREVSLRKIPEFGKVIAPCSFLRKRAFDDNARTCMSKSQPGLDVVHVDTYEAMMNPEYFDSKE